MIYSAVDIASILCDHVERHNDVDETVIRMKIVLEKYPSLVWCLPAVHRQLAKIADREHRKSITTISIADSEHLTPLLSQTILERVCNIGNIDNVVVDVEPDIIGGFIVRSNGTVHDYSLRTKLNKIKTLL